MWPGRGVGSAERWERACRERSWATSSVLSFAAFTARVVGTVRREAAKAPMASCSREPCENVSICDVWFGTFPEDTYNTGRPFFEVDVQRRLHSAASWYYPAGF